MNPLARDSMRLVIYGGGGHGRVVAEAAELVGLQVLGFVDDAPDPNRPPTRWPLLRLDHPDLDQAHWLVGIGDNMARRRISEDLLHDGRALATVIHPAACVSPSAVLGQGVFVGPRAVVHAAAILSDGVIVNSGAIVEHDCRIGPYSHIAPGAVLGGGVTVGAVSLVGLGAALLPRVRVGEHCIIGAGAVVIRDVPNERTALGVPACLRE